MCFHMLLYFTVGYSLMNVLDPKGGGAMVVAYFPEGRPVWLDQIRDRFLHPTSESLATYGNTILGEDGGYDLDDSINPTREEVIILSSEGSDGSHEGLIPRSTHAGPPQGTVNEPVNEPAKKKRVDKCERKKAEETAAEAPRKRPSNSSFLDFVVVSDTLSGLDAGDKHADHGPDDDATLTEIKETTAALSESEFDLGVFSAKPHNLLEKIYKSASGSRGTIFLFEDDVEVEQVGDGGDGVGGGDGRGGGVDTEVESSEATPRHTIYTKRPPGSGGGGTSGVRQSPEYEHVQGGSWDTHNPTCADLPHAPRWNLT
ncbi:hypothetical protein Hanom_Chr12g01127021 [Helianthus anomalus]